MNYILFDDETRLSLLPFTFTRPVAEIRMGILTLREKWEKYLGQQVSFFTEAFLQDKFPLKTEADNILINGAVLPDESLLKEINALKAGEKISGDGFLIAWRITGDELNSITSFHKPDILNAKVYPVANKISFCWDIFSMNEKALTADFKLLTAKKRSQPISSTNQVISPENIFLEEGARVECSMLNASGGFIYIGKDAEVMEGAMIRGPFSLGEHAQVKMGAKIYGATTIGPHCRIGGEVSNSVIFGCSNKAHDGFLGNSVIGEWCNLGADSNNSNLKNNYSQVKMWNYSDENFVNTGLTFCGLMMGDHSKCSINTMFNTGTVVGVSANIFGTGFPPKFVPSFSWGGSEGFKTYRLEEAVEVASRVYERRGMKLDDKEQKILKYLFEATTKFRSW
ncbi:MAG: GlmU family protein [Bacteroidetes bacterium]|nr:GlmU family protein [Bacteroidota bacterium]